MYSKNLANNMYIAIANEKFLEVAEKHVGICHGNVGRGSGQFFIEKLIFCFSKILCNFLFL